MAELRDLPIHVLILILLRLPAKLLTQFKTVSKLWSQVISSPNFINLHFDTTLTLTPSQNPNRRLVFCSSKLYSADFDTFSNITLLDHPFQYNAYGVVRVGGSCHGLLCLQIHPYYTTIYLYNPTNRTHKKLPFSSKPESYPYSYYFGFGYDAESRDFKFVRILTTSDELINENEPFWSQVMVYSLRADSWTGVRDSNPPRLSTKRKDAVFVHGNLHWVGNRFDDDKDIRNSIVGFNLSDNRFNQVPLPLYEMEHVGLQIGVLDGCLCVLTNDSVDMNVWVIKEYGVVETWSLLYKFKRDPSLSLEWPFESPIAFSVDRRELFLQADYWWVVSLDLETLELKKVEVAGLRSCSGTHVCVDNLMILKDDPELGGNRKRRIGCVEEELEGPDGIRRSRTTNADHNMAP